MVSRTAGDHRPRLSSLTVAHRPGLRAQGREMQARWPRLLQHATRAHSQSPCPAPPHLGLHPRDKQGILLNRRETPSCARINENQPGTAEELNSTSHTTTDTRLVLIVPARATTDARLVCIIPGPDAGRVTRGQPSGRSAACTRSSGAVRTYARPARGCSWSWS